MVHTVRRNWLVSLLACLFCLMIGLATAIIIGRTQAEYWIIFGGNTDPGDGQGGGMARDQMIAGGWTSEGASYQVHWAAAIEQGTKRITDEAMAAGHTAFDEHCGNRRCIIAGFSLGNAPALQLSAEVGLPPDQTYLFGAPQPSTGAFHNPSADNPLVEPWVATMGGLATDRPVAAGMQAFYNSRDPYANAAPQCNGPGLFSLNVQAGHYIISREESTQHVWTGPDGVVMHEAGYVAPPGLPRSGSDPAQAFDGCPPGGYFSHNDTPAEPGPVPFVPGQPQQPDPSSGPIPGGSPIPSQEGNMPGLPGLPLPAPAPAG